MKYSIFIKTLLSYPLSGMHHLKNYIINKPSVLILMYHRILNNKYNNSLVQEGMYVDKETFKRHIGYLKQYYDIVSLESCLDIVQNKKTRIRPLCCVTFDDGWKDFYENAFPILRENDAAATVFLPTNYIDTDRLFWTDKLGKIIIGLDSMEGDRSLADPGEPMIESICGLSGSPMERFEAAIRMLKALPANRIDDINDNLFARLGISRDETERSFLSWDEVRSMRASGVVQFGSHTRNHVILTTIGEDEISEELEQSKATLVEKGAVSESFIPFSYPNGNYSDRIANQVKNAGYHLAVTTKRGLNHYAEYPIDLYGLERIGIHQDISGTNSMFSCRINGLF